MQVADNLHRGRRVRPRSRDDDEFGRIESVPTFVNSGYVATPLMRPCVGGCLHEPMTDWFASVPQGRVVVQEIAAALASLTRDDVLLITGSDLAVDSNLDVTETRPRGDA